MRTRSRVTEEERTFGTNEEGRKGGKGGEGGGRTHVWRNEGMDGGMSVLICV